VAAFIASSRLKIKDCSKTVQESYSSSHLCTTRESAINGKSWIMMHRCFNCKKVCQTYQHLAFRVIN